MAKVEYKSDSVLTAARKRISEVFDASKRVIISVSSGKDSTVLCHLALQEAKKRNVKPILFFLDQEAEWQSSIDLMEKMMSNPDVVPEWYQVPIKMTNATSHKDLFLDAWHEGREWVREKHPLAIHKIEGKYPDRFYDFFKWHEQQQPEGTSYLVGLRSKESLSRFRAISKNAGVEGVSWSTGTSKKGVLRYYPLYDFTFGDIWKYIQDEGLEYNRLYDRMFWKYGTNISAMRVSNLIHEKSFKAIADLQEFEPDTYERLLRRLSGVHCAALYAKDKFVYSADELPKSFSSWLAYRDHLLATTPIEKKSRFVDRFARQSTDEATCRDQVKQILCNDWENNLPVRLNVSEKLRKKWWNRL